MNRITKLTKLNMYAISLSDYPCDTRLGSGLLLVVAGGGQGLFYWDNAGGPQGWGQLRLDGNPTHGGGGQEVGW